MYGFPSSGAMNRDAIVLPLCVRACTASCVEMAHLSFRVIDHRMLLTAFKYGSTL